MEVVEKKKQVSLQLFSIPKCIIVLIDGGAAIKCLILM